MASKIDILIQAQDNASKQLANIEASMAKLGGGTKALGSSFSGLGGVMTTLVGSAGFMALKSALGSCIDEAKNAGIVNRQLDAVLKSTGGAVGYTADQLKGMAVDLQNHLGISHDVIQAGQNMLLTFTNIGHDVFPTATQAVLDMATAMNGGVTPGAEQLRGTAIQLGKALQDPILGMTALRRVGVNFDEESKNMVKTMLEHNNLMGAQKFILAELQKEFGGSADAQATASKKLSVAMDEMKEAIGNVLLPIITAFKEAITPLIINLTKWMELNPGLTKTIVIVVASLVGLLSTMALLGPMLGLMGIEIGAIIGPVLAVTAGIGALAIVGVSLYNSFTNGASSANKVGTSYTDLSKQASDLSDRQKELDKNRKNGTISMVEYNKTSEELKTEQKKVSDQLSNTTLTGSELRQEFDKINNSKLSADQKVIELRKIQKQAQDSANSVDTLMQKLLKLLKEKQAISASEQKQTNMGVRSNVGAGSIAGTIQMDVLNAQANILGYQPVVDGVSKVVSDIQNIIGGPESSSGGGIGGAIGGGKEKITESQKAVEDLTKSMKDLGYTNQTVTDASIAMKGKDKTAIEELGTYYKTLKDNVKTSFDKINNEIHDSADKILDYKNQITDLQVAFKGLGDNQNKDIASAYVDAKSQLASVTAEINKGGLSPEDLASKTAEQQSLQNTIASVFAGMSTDAQTAIQKQIDAQTAYNALNPIEKVKQDYKDKLDAMSAEITQKITDMNTEQTHYDTLVGNKKKAQKTWMDMLNTDQISQLKQYDDLITKATALANARSKAGLSATISATNVSGAKAGGGPVLGGNTYLVGENGPELFTPAWTGEITPNNKIGGATTVSVNLGSVNIYNEADENKLIDKISSALTRQIQLYKLGIY